MQPGSGVTVSPLCDCQLSPELWTGTGITDLSVTHAITHAHTHTHLFSLLLFFTLIHDADIDLSSTSVIYDAKHPHPLITSMFAGNSGDPSAPPVSTQPVNIEPLHNTWTHWWPRSVFKYDCIWFFFFFPNSIGCQRKTADEGRLAHQVFGSERLSLFADDEAVPDSQLAEQLPPACNVTICCHVAGTEEDPVTAWNGTKHGEQRLNTTAWRSVEQNECIRWTVRKTTTTE